MSIRTRVLVAALGLAIAAPSLSTVSFAAIGPDAASALSKTVKPALAETGAMNVAANRWNPVRPKGPVAGIPGKKRPRPDWGRPKGPITGIPGKKRPRPDWGRPKGPITGIPFKRKWK